MDTSGRIVLPRAKSSGAAGLVKTAEQAAALRASRAAEQTLTDLLNETAAAAADAFDDDEDDDTTDDDTTDAFVPGNLAPFLRTLGKRLHTALNNNDGSAAAAAAASSYSVRYTEAAPCVTTMFQGGVHFLVLSPSASSSPSSNTTATTAIPPSSSAPGIRVSSPPRQSPPTEAELASREGAVFVVLNMRAHWSLRCGGSRRYRALLAEALHGGEHFVGTQPRLWTLLESLEKVLRADVFERDLPPWRRAFAWKAALGRPPCAAEETEAAAAAERPAAALHEFITEATVEEGGEAEAASAGAPSSSSAEDCSEYGLGSSLGHLTSVDSCESLHDAAAAAQRSRRQQQQHISVASATA
eukprot:Rhum_TRINITY_DN14837_c12_g1::Rhum_TRINITY_DN14837_c12_g1_i1::g.120360::m.120360